MYNPIKAAQVVAFFALKNDTRTIDILKVIKLVYLSDRESISKWGFPILNEPRFSMRHGPVNSITYSHINGEHNLETCGWAEYLEDRANFQVSITDDKMVDDLDELSDADIECMEKVWNVFGAMDKWELVDWTHDANNIPEWEDPKGSSVAIPLRRIMQNVKIEDVDGQIEVINDHKNIDIVFSSVAE